MRRLFFVCAGLTVFVGGCRSLGNEPVSSTATTPVVRGQNAAAPSTYQTSPPFSPSSSFQPATPLAAAIPQVAAVQREQFARRPLGLQQAIAAALERSPIVRTLSGGVRIETTTGLDPLIAEAQLRGENARFDPNLAASYVGGQINKPPSSFFGPGIETQTRRDEADFQVSVNKSFPLGTTATVMFDPPLGYLFYPTGTSSGFNPAYSSEVVFDVRQPLLKGRGSNVNLAPIRIATTKVDQSRWQVQQATMAQVRSVVEAYWRLHAAYIGWQAVEAVLPLAADSVRIEELRHREERSIYADVARAKTNLETLLQERTRAKLTVYKSEYYLRQLIGLPPRDGLTLLPSDAPHREKFAIDLQESVATALARRPDMAQRRSRLEQRNWEMLFANNQKLPQLDVEGLYRTSGLSNRLDNSLRQMSRFGYTDWTVGLTFTMPIGLRKAKADADVAALQLARDQALLVAYEDQVAFEVADLAAEVDAAWERYESFLRQVHEAEEWLKVARIRYENPPVAAKGQDWLLLSLFDYQAAIRNYSSALTQAANLIADYNTLLARLDESRGTLLERWMIQFDGDAPAGGEGYSLAIPQNMSFAVTPPESSFNAGHVFQPGMPLPTAYSGTGQTVAP